MDINQISSLLQYSIMSGMSEIKPTGASSNSDSSTSETSTMPPPPPGGEHVDISAVGQLLQVATGVSDETMTELQDFGHKVMEAMQSGSFDAEALAEEAPEELKTLAEENGVDLTEALDELAAKMAEFEERMQTMVASGTAPPERGAGQDGPPDLLSMFFGIGSDNE